MSGGDGRRIVLLVEGDTERAAKAHIKRFLDERAEKEGKPKVGLHVVTFDGSIMKANLHRRVEIHLKNPSILGVVALADLYPDFKGMSADAARTQILAQMPQDGRCRAHVAKHDFEAWLLTGWQAILDHANIENKKPWGALPEEINHDKPPAHRIRELFDHHAKPYKKYKKPVDGLTLFKKLVLEEVAAVCPEFRLFLNCLLDLGGYQTLTDSADLNAGEKPSAWQDSSWMKKKLKDLAALVLELLIQRALPIDDAVRGQIETCTDEGILSRWMGRVHTVSCAADIFIEP